EGGRIVDGELGEHATVDLDTSGLEALDETVVGHAVGAGAGVDALDPEATEVALALATVTVAVDQRVDDLFLGLAVQARALSAVAACPVEDDPALLVSVDRSLHTCHVLLLRRIRICRRCRTLVQAVGADGRLPEDPGICPGRPVKGSHLPDRKSTRLNSSHVSSSYAVFCLKKKKLTHICYLGV